MTEEQIKELKQALRELIAENKELRADIAKMKQHGEELYTDLGLELPAPGSKKQVNIQMVLMKLLPNVTNPAWQEKLYKKHLEPLFELYLKYK